MITSKNTRFLIKFGSSNHIDQFLKKDSSYRAAIAHHKNLQPHHIDKLMKDKNQYVKGRLAKNPKYQEYIKEKK